jgi:NAD(P)-dependent dehydrogenase (short-subunit alcohol dehydrogenase family)
MLRLKNKTLLITGGLHGAGKLCGIAAAREGANVAVAGIKSFASFKALEEIQRESPSAIFVECDVNDYDQVETAIERVTDYFSTIDIALNYVSADSRVDDPRAPAEARGVYNCMKHELSFMSRQRKGVIVNISSALDEVDLGSTTHYVTLKRGVEGISKNAAFEYAGEGIRINAILYARQRARAGASINAPTMTSVAAGQEGLANLFLFLASDASSQVYGTTLEIASTK